MSLWSPSFLDCGSTTSWPEAKCEDLGHTLAPPLQHRLHAPWDAVAAHRTFAKAGLESASSSAGAPVAAWFLGEKPEATVQPRFAKEVGIPIRHDRFSFKFDAVTMDDEQLRLQIPGYQNAVLDGLKRGCTWRGLDAAISNSFGMAKESLLDEATSGKKHIIITSSSSSTDECLSHMRRLAGAGYQNHVVLLEKTHFFSVWHAESAGSYDPENFRQLSKEANGKVMHFWMEPGADSPTLLSRSDCRETGPISGKKSVGGSFFNAADSLRFFNASRRLHAECEAMPQK